MFLQEEYGPFTADDVIRIAPEEEEEAELRTRLNERRAKAKEEKKRRRGEESEEQKLVSKKERKERKKERAADAASRAVLAIAGPTSEGGDSTLGVKASSVAQAAARAVQKEMMSSNGVYKSIFNDGKNKVDNNKLFIVSGASRYTIS